jgi:tryptophanyl-tRNA synthetase
LTEQPKKKRVVSGMRPTGKLHIGHYFGALQNWVRLQNDPTYECFYFIADWHALTSDYADTSAVAQNTIEIVTDYLAAGLDPQKCVIFQQSLVPEHAELNLLLGMTTPLGELERVPTYKEQLQNISDKDLHTYGFLGYPVLQTADIVIYSDGEKPLFVPVGEDQVSHVELSRKIVQVFNFLYGLKVASVQLHNAPPDVSNRVAKRLGLDVQDGKKMPFQFLNIEVAAYHRAKAVGHQNFLNEMKEDAIFFLVSPVLTEPGVMLTATPRIPGLDGRKMSKSYGNAITLSESDADIRAKTKVMVTDPARKRRTDPGNPDVCPVYDWHKLFSTPATLQWAAEGCRTAGIGCIECKAKMADHLIEWITPVRERRVQYEQHPKRVLEVIDDGSKRAQVEAQKTMARVREAVFAWEKKRTEIGNS